MATQRQLRLGDLIEIFREDYQHWAVYVGDNYLVHLTNDGGGSSSSVSGTTVAEVKRQTLLIVCENDKWRINNYLDNDYEPRSANVIVREALALVGTLVAYSLFSMNCEHFATELRYGTAHSQQVEDADLVAHGVVTTVTGLVRDFGVVPVIALGASLASGAFGDIPVIALRALVSGRGRIRAGPALPLDRSGKLLGHQEGRGAAAPGKKKAFSTKTRYVVFGLHILAIITSGYTYFIPHK